MTGAAVVLISVSEIEPAPFAAALLMPATVVRLQAIVVPAVALVALYVNATPLVVVTDRLLDKTGIVLGAATSLPAALVQPFIVWATV